MSATKSTPVIEPYLFFNGRCEEAVKFYQNALGAEVQMMMSYKESPEPTPPGMAPPDWGDKIMHASLRIGATLLMASDGCGGKTVFEGFSLSFSVPNEADANRAFTGLSDGGQVRMPLGKTFWSPCFGMVQDKFGVGWMVSVTPAI